MDHDSLVDSRLDEGEVLLRALDRAKFEVDAALWLFNTEASTYRLLISTPKIRHGRTRTYEEVARTLGRLKIGIALSDLMVVGPDDPLVRGLTGVIATGRFARIRVNQSTFNGIHIEDALIYRLPEPAKRGHATTRRQLRVGSN